MRRSWLLLLLLTVSCGRGTLDLSSGSQEGFAASSDDGVQPPVDSGAIPTSRDDLSDAPDASIDFEQPSGAEPVDAGPSIPTEPDAGDPPCWEPGQQCSPRRPYCDRWGRCVECWSSVHCRGGEVCDELRGDCVPGCFSDRDCSEIGQECDFNTNLCVQCTTSFHCSEVFGPTRSVCFDNWCQSCNEFRRCPGNLFCDDGSCVSFEGPPPPDSSSSGMMSMDDSESMMTPTNASMQDDDAGRDSSPSSFARDAGADAGTLDASPPPPLGPSAP